MKNLKRISLFLLAAFCLSCSSDDDKPNFSTTDLIGSWKRVSELENGIETIEEGDCDFITIITETTIGAKEYYGTDCSMFSEDAPSTYVLTGKNITVTDAEGSNTSEILILNTTTLSSKYVLVENGVTYVYISTYSKQ